MKPKILNLLLGGLLAGSLAVSAQTTAPAAGDSQDTSGAATNAASSTPTVADNSTSAATPSQAAAEPAPTAEAAPAQTAATRAADQNASAAEPSAATPGATNAIIPLVVMDDVPLTDAIKNLARQANLNYMLDPKLNYGQPGPDGKPVSQPVVSIRWENVTAEQALMALLGNYGLQLVQDPKTGIARITIRDPKAPPPLFTKIIQLQYASPSNILAAVHATLSDPRSRVIGDVRTSQLVVVATEPELDAVQHLVARLDTRTRQVLIEARLLETSMNPSSVKGIDWSGTLQQQHFEIGNDALSGTPATPATPAYVNPSTGTIIPAVPAQAGTIGGILSAPALIGSLTKGSFFSPATAFLNADGLKAVLSFLNTYSEAKVLSAPRTVTLDNEMAHIEVGQDYPIINVTAGTANTTGGSQITYSNLTVTLDVTPRISANDYINLKVAPKALRLDHVQTFTVGGQPFQVPIFDTRVITTTVMIPSGDTLVMGGLIQDNILNQNTKVPLLGDIPGLGYLFRQDSKQRQKSNLIVFITPTIVHDSDFQPTQTDFLKTPVPTSDSLDGDWSAWNSGQPYDWSKPKKASNSSAPVYQNPPQ